MSRSVGVRCKDVEIEDNEAENNLRRDCDE